MAIAIRNVRKKFGDFTALKNVSLDIESGELIALLGPSGSGKTTLLRIIAGLEIPDAGKIFLQGRDTANLSARERNVGFMFQHYALFKHMTVFDNVAFGLNVRNRARRPSKAAIHGKVMELLRLVRLEDLHERYPAQLSGGQRQRVALARALAVEPRVLLLDEPFGALDAKVRKELRRFIRRLHETIHVTTVFVTHDQEEAMEVADRVVVMSHGAIEQIGTPSEVWHQPANRFVYDFLGNYNEFDGWKGADGSIHLSEYDRGQPSTPAPKGEPNPPLSAWRRYPRTVRMIRKIAPGFALQPTSLPSTPQGRQVVARSGSGTPIKLYARPHELIIVREASDHGEYISARILHINPAGPLAKVEMERKNGSLLQAEVPASLVQKEKLVKGMTVLVRPTHTRVFADLAGLPGR
jgi:sulfate/thiosulfate transport system ATP-binding protein